MKILKNEQIYTGPSGLTPLLHHPDPKRGPVRRSAVRQRAGARGCEQTTVANVCALSGLRKQRAAVWGHTRREESAPAHARQLEPTTVRAHLRICAHSLPHGTVKPGQHLLLCCTPAPIFARPPTRVDLWDLKASK